jgi:hypothetical protein
MSVALKRKEKVLQTHTLNGAREKEMFWISGKNGQMVSVNEPEASAQLTKYSDIDGENDGNDLNHLEIKKDEDGKPVPPQILKEYSLDTRKGLLQEFVKAVRGDCKTYPTPLNASDVLIVFQRLSAIPPWAKIKADNWAYIQIGHSSKFTLDEPSRMTQDAVNHFLKKWRKKFMKKKELLLFCANSRGLSVSEDNKREEVAAHRSKRKQMKNRRTRKVIQDTDNESDNQDLVRRTENAEKRKSRSAINNDQGEELTPGPTPGPTR